MRSSKISLGLSVMILLLATIACQKEIITIGTSAQGDFIIKQNDEYNYTLINQTKGPNISRWRIPNLGKTFQGDSVSLYIGSSGTYDVIHYPASKGGIDSVVKQITVKNNDSKLYAKQSPIIVSGWYNDGWNQVSHQVYLDNDQLFSEVNPYWYNLGTSDHSPGNKVSDGTIYERSYVFNSQQIAQVRSRGDLFIPTIGDMDREQLNRILNSQAAQDTLISNLIKTAKNRNYDGWDLNFEHANENGKVQFNAFVKKLGTALKLNGKILDVTIGGFPDALHESYWIFDYDGLNIPEVRYIKIMAYDQYLGGTPTLNPVSEYGWVINILDYAIHSRNVPPKKIILGIANYGWSFKFPNDVAEIIRPFTPYSEYMAKPGFQSWYQDWCDELYGEWTVNGVYHAAFFNNAQSVDKRMELVNLYGLAGVCFWVLGKEDPEIYSSKIPTTFPGTR